MQIERMAAGVQCLYQPVAAATGTRSLQIRIKGENAIVIIVHRASSKHQKNNHQPHTMYLLKGKQIGEKRQQQVVFSHRPGDIRA